MLKEEVKPRLDDVKALIMDLIYSDDSLEDFENLAKINQLLGLFEVSVMELYDDNARLRRRAIKAEFDLRHTKEKLEALAKED